LGNNQEDHAMTDYSNSIDIPVPSQRTFAFVSDVSNFPRFVPTTRRASMDGGHIHVEGISHGASYADDGRLYIDAERRLMRWGSGESAYRGELSVNEANGGSRVEIKLHFKGSEHAPPPQEVERSLEESLARLRQELAPA
jgi:hypothetical protein